MTPVSVATRAPWVAPSSHSAVSAGSSAKGSRHMHHRLTEDVLLQICAVDVCANSYRVKLSVWDASLFLFYPQLGSIANGLLLFSLVFNTVVQLLFVYVVFFFFGHEVLSDETVAGFWTWRAAVDEGTREMVRSCFQRHGDETTAVTTTQRAHALCSVAITYLRKSLEVARAKERPTNSQSVNETCTWTHTHR